MPDVACVQNPVGKDHHDDAAQNQAPRAYASAPAWHSLYLMLIVLLSQLFLLPTAAGNVCEDQLLVRPVFSAFAALPELHPANVVLKNLVVGTCNAQRYVAETSEILEWIDGSRDVIRLLGGELPQAAGGGVEDDDSLVHLSRQTQESTTWDSGSGDESGSYSNGWLPTDVCPSFEVYANCAQYHSTKIFETLPREAWEYIITSNHSSNKSIDFNTRCVHTIAKCVSFLN
jgi:hypothetical protein